MIKYILKRIGLMIPVLIGVIFVVFTINRVMPGDPAVSIAGPNAAPEVYEQIREDLGLNEPFLVQFFNYLKDIVTKFDLGTSYQTGRSVTTEILDRCPSTIILGLVGVAITVILGIPFGIISATKQYSPLDYGVTFTSLILASMPGFWLALILMLFFSLRLLLCVCFASLGRWAFTCGLRNADYQIQYAGGRTAGLHPHGACKRRNGIQSHHKARTEKCADSRCHHGRYAIGQHHGRLRGHRVYFCDSRSRNSDDGGNQHKGLSRYPRQCAVPVDLHQRYEPSGRCNLRVY